MIRDGNDSSRCKRLGDWGEMQALILLVEAQFTEVVNLNVESPNFPWADACAVKLDRRYAISVKTRNERTNTGTLNDRYKLGKRTQKQLAVLGSPEKQVQDVERNLGAEAAWITIALRRHDYDAFFGTVRQIRALSLKGTGVMMTPEYTQNYHVLARNRPNGLTAAEYDRLRNR